MVKHGAVAWFEIGTPDSPATREFYAQLFGWTYADTPDVGMPYHIVTTGEGHPIGGGILDTRGEFPAYAVPCVVVEDTAATVAKVEELGGKVLVPPRDVPNGMSVAYVLDPHGNEIGLYTPPPGEQM